MQSCLHAGQIPGIKTKTELELCGVPIVPLGLIRRGPESDCVYVFALLNMVYLFQLSLSHLYTAVKSLCVKTTWQVCFNQFKMIF